MNVDLQEKTVLITGGSGMLGTCLVEEAITMGARVLCTYWHNEEQARKLERMGAAVYRCDLSSRDDIRALSTKIKGCMQRLDVLINNAVTLCDKTIVNLSIDEWDQVLAVGLDGVFYLTQQFLPLLFKSVRGNIINVVSQAGAHGGFGQANYAAAKGGLIALTKSLAKELGRKNILVNAVNPGFMPSRLTEHIPESLREDNKKRSVLATWSDPRDAARFILYLASDNVRTVSGQFFNFDSRVF